MKIVLPMAGFGTRMRPHTWSRPKPLLSVADKPVLGHVLDMFAALPSIEEVILIVGYQGDQIEHYMQQAHPATRARFVVQEEMNGQSMAIWLARQWLSGPMMMAFVDTLIDADLSRLSEESAGAVAWVKEVEDPRRFGVARLGADGWISGLVEKPQSMENNLAVVGAYYFKEAADLLSAIEQQVQDNIQLKGEFYLADAINIMIARGLRMRVQPVTVWEDCGKPDALLATNRYLLDHGRDNCAAAARDGVKIIPPVFISPEARVQDSSIGPYASIGAGCVIEGSSIADSIVEAGSTIRRSHLRDSLVGQGTLVEGIKATVNIGDTSQIAGA